MNEQNLRKVDEYSIGLDIGTGSVGWCVVDKDGRLCKFNGKHTWGSRVFDGANPASDARTYRSARRRLIRRKWRLNFLQDIFKSEVDQIDPDFFYRLNNQFRVKDEKNFNWPIFNDKKLEKEYYKKYPTIYHLRADLINNQDEKFDIRLIYLALHNICKYRGNFLREDEKISSQNSDISKEIDKFINSLISYIKFEDSNEVISDNYYNKIKNEVSSIKEIFSSKDKYKNPSDKSSEIGKILANTGTKEIDNSIKLIAKAICGLKVDFGSLFLDNKESKKFSLSKSEDVEAFVCDENYQDIFASVRKIYQAYILQNIIRPGKTISESKVEDYNDYKEQLKILKSLAKKYLNEENYKEMFSGAYYNETHKYDVNKAKGYTRYNLGINKSGSNSKVKGDYETFKKYIIDIFSKTDAVKDKLYNDIVEQLNEEKFLVRQKTSNNGVIPYQLHLEELNRIIENQSKFYDFLKNMETQSHIQSLVTFRIPYYVGPMQDNCAPTNSHGKTRFRWAVKYKDAMDKKITPWNWDEIIDKHTSAETFITRMTGKCTYLPDQDVLPKCSLLYEEFCVLNELNGSHFTKAAEPSRRFNHLDKEKIINNLFKKKRGYIKYADVENELYREGCFAIKVSGGQGTNKYMSRLNSYMFFKCDVFNLDYGEEIPNNYFKDIEKIILWNTVYEDRSILKARLISEFVTGDNNSFQLNLGQVDTICKKRFTGWGNLSKKLLDSSDIGVDFCAEHYSIMDILRRGNPFDSKKSTMIFKEIIKDKNFKIQQQIDDYNFDIVNNLCLEDLPGSPAIRRSINQAERIITEIIKITKKQPENIYLENTREDDIKNKGKRTKTRYEQIKNAIKELHNQYSDLITKDLAKDLNSDKDRLDDDRLFLYYLQNGKCMYSGEALEINRLSEYEIDHIIPRMFTTDNSISNRVLVKRKFNQEKNDRLLLEESIIKKMYSTWKAMLDVGLITKKKFDNLICRDISERKMLGFINRQLVETSQIIKLLSLKLKKEYPNTKVNCIKASLSSALQHSLKLYKCREANDYHHAHDAFIAAQIGRYINIKHPEIFTEPVRYAHQVKAFIKAHSSDDEGIRFLKGSPSFIVAGMLSDYKGDWIDENSGEILWDKEKEIDYIKKCFDIKDCFISRMLIESTDMFWKDTIFSPRIKKGNISIKNNMDVLKYGGYSSINYSFFFIYQRTKNKGKNNKELVFCGYPVHLRNNNLEKKQILDYVYSIEDKHKYCNFKIICPKIYINQKFNYNNMNFYITGLKDIKPDKQISFTNSEICILSNIANHKANKKNDLFNYSNDDFIKLFRRIKTFLTNNNIYLSKKIKLDIFSEDSFLKLLNSSNNDDKLNALYSLLSLCVLCKDGKRDDVYLPKIGLKNGRLNKDLYSFINDPSFYLINQSVTGMFEKKTKIEI